MFQIDFDISLEDFTERGSGREREKAEKRARRTKLRQGSGLATVQSYKHRKLELGQGIIQLLVFLFFSY